MQVSWRGGAVLGLMLALALPAVQGCVPERAAAQTLPGEHGVSLSVSQVPLAPGDGKRQRLGALEYRGGFEIRSSDPDFGGLSGLVVGGDGKSLLAISDEGHWFAAELAYDGEGRLTGIGNGRIAPLLDEDGKPLEHKRWQDAEGLGMSGGTAFVSFEREHRVWAYDLAGHGFAAPARQVAGQADLGDLVSNSGLETVTAMPGSTAGPVRLLALAEGGADAEGHLKGFILEDGRIGHLSLRERKPYSPTDAGFLPDGDLLVLERRYSPIGGVGMEIRRIPAALVREGGVLDGPVIAEAGGGPFSIDNMEGMSLRRTADGRTLIYLISDDNFNHGLQRTLLLMFELKG
ncbi:MAG: esterase-like activity of phytase family protein [Parvibaculaceae bacterium]|nr:esterase-like activity of phytase family protein [Parvibaculaceae bacterium]